MKNILLNFSAPFGWCLEVVVAPFLLPESLK